jgi:hypothetical protein
VRALRNSLAAACLGALSLAALGAPAASAAECPNEALRQGQGATALPGCMALEMVTPPRKSSQPAYLPSFSHDGNRVLAIAQTALAGTPGYQYYGGDRYVITRDAASGWKTSSTSPQEPTISAGGRRWGSAVLFTPDLSNWAQLGSTQVQYNVGIAQLFKGGLDRSFEPLSPLLVPIDDSGSDRIATSVLDLQLAGAAADLSTSVLRVALGSTGYFPEDPRASSFLPEPGEDRNSYVAFINESGEPDLELLARDNDDIVYGGRCGAHLGGDGSTFNQGAISPDGDRILFTTRPAQEWDEEELKGPSCDTDNGLRVLERLATPEGPVISEIPGGPGGEGDDLFQAASVDGSKVYLMSPRKLSGTDTDSVSGPCSGNLGASSGCDLYLYDATEPEGERVIQVSDGEGADEADVLLSATAISGDGTHAYFVAQGVLTSDVNPEGDSAVAGQPNLYLYDTDTDGLSFIGTLSPGDPAGMWATKGSGFGDAYAAPTRGASEEEGGDGHVLAFASKAPLTEDDEDLGFRDVFRYDATADTLERISKAPEGGEDNGSFDVSVNPAFLKLIEYNFGETTRWMSEDAENIAFATAEPLVPSDTDAANNPYVWDGGELGAVITPITEPPTAAPTGGQIAFATPKALLPPDGDVVKDVYVARANGGFVEPTPPIPCDPLSEGACEGPPSPKLGSVPLPTNGANLKPPHKKCKKGLVRKVRRNGKVRCVKNSRGSRRSKRHHSSSGHGGAHR